MSSTSEHPVALHRGQVVPRGASRPAKPSRRASRARGPEPKWPSARVSSQWRGDRPGLEAGVGTDPLGVTPRCSATSPCKATRGNGDCAPIAPPTLRTADFRPPVMGGCGASSSDRMTGERLNHTPIRSRDTNAATARPVPRRASLSVSQTGRTEATRKPTGVVVNALFAGILPAERRRSRTYQPWGYHGLPVLKISGVWLIEPVWAGSAPPIAPPAWTVHGRPCTCGREFRPWTPGTARQSRTHVRFSDSRPTRCRRWFSRGAQRGASCRAGRGVEGSGSWAFSLGAERSGLTGRRGIGCGGG